MERIALAAAALALTAAGCTPDPRVVGGGVSTALPITTQASQPPTPGDQDPAATDSAARAAARPTPGAPDAGSPADAGVVPPTGPPRAAWASGPGAGGLSISMECDEGRGTSKAVLRWVPASPRGSDQRVTMSEESNGFAKGRFLSSGSLGPDRSTYAWSGLGPNLDYWFRVETRRGDTWVPSATVTGQGRPDCSSPNAGGGG